MTRKERVLTAIRHGKPDRVPKGEIGIEAGLLRALVGEDAWSRLDPCGRMLRACELLGADLINVHQFPMDPVGQTEDGQTIFRSVLGDEHVITAQSSHLVWSAIGDASEAFAYRTPDANTCRTDQLDAFLSRSDLFVMAQVMGPISALDWMLGTEDYLVWAMTETEAVLRLSEKVTDYELSRALTFVDHHADAILIADDMAYNTGPILPPSLMENLVWPFYRRMIRAIKARRDVPVFLHTDGNITSLLPHIVECGFDGLQSLQPSAGVDIAQVKRDYGACLCLMGNLDLNHLLPFGTPQEVEKQVRWLCENIGRDGGFILSTCNILTDAVPVANALAMYRAAEELGASYSVVRKY